MERVSHSLSGGLKAGRGKSPLLFFVGRIDPVEQLRDKRSVFGRPASHPYINEYSVLNLFSKIM